MSLPDGIFRIFSNIHHFLDVRFRYISGMLHTIFSLRPEVRRNITLKWSPGTSMGKCNITQFENTWAYSGTSKGCVTLHSAEWSQHPWHNVTLHQLVLGEHPRQVEHCTPVTLTERSQHPCHNVTLHLLVLGEHPGGNVTLGCLMCTRTSRPISNITASGDNRNTLKYF